MLQFGVVFCYFARLLQIEVTPDGKVLYRNAFTKSLTVDDANVAEVVASGCARWKIENENNNMLKTKGGVDFK